MATVIENILEKLPTDAKIASHSYEGANIILYTKSPAFFKQGFETIHHLVDEFKKRIDLRADSSLRLDEEKTKEFVEKTIPKEAQVTKVFFEPARSLITIEAKQPGDAIGKSGAVLKSIKEKTYWTPIVRRDSLVESKITDKIRSVLYEDSKDRRKFLDDVGKRIYEIRRRPDAAPWARISFLGGARQVGRSCLLLQTQESNIILDCGIDPSSDRDNYPILTAPEFNIAEIDAVVVSHSHLDHSGFVPYLFKYGYRGPVYCTAPTRDTMALLQLDYINVSHSKAKDPPYSSNDIQEMVKHTITMEYGEVTDITPDIRVTLYSAGHILGSALVHLHIGEGWHNILYTGDFKTKDSLLLDGAHKTFPRVETLIMESTYGGPDDIMPPHKECDDAFKKIISETIKKGGKVLVPVLGSGRAQEVMLMVDELMKESKIKVPVYIDGMVWDITALHNAYPEFLGTEVRKKIFYDDKNPFLSGMFKQVGSQKERQEVLDGGPCLILASSGMLVGGPSVTYFGELAPEKKNTIIFVSYQGENSLGAKVQRGEKHVMIETYTGNKEVDVKMNVESIVGLSGHADKNELISYIHNMSPTPRRIIIVHGEKNKTLNLASTLHKTFSVETTAPRPLDAVRLK